MSSKEMQNHQNFLTTEKYVLEREGEEENFLKVEILFDDDLQIPALVFSFFCV